MVESSIYTVVSSRDHAKEELARARAATDGTFALVQPDSIYERPIPLRHRLIFYLGHVEAFDWNLIVEHGVPSTRFDQALDRLFAFGIDPGPGKAPADNPSDWPDIEKVQDYRTLARKAVDACWDALPAQLQQTCREHRLMHAETIAYMLHNMDHSRLVPHNDEEPLLGPSVFDERIRIPAGMATLGKRNDDSFGWDNEFDEHTVPVETFLIDRYKVTNARYLAFVEAGAPAPHFWVRENGTWFLRRMFDRVPLPLNSPVWVTHKEAAAYAEWTGGAIPTEAQWHRAAYGTPEGAERMYPWGNTTPVEGSHGQFDVRKWDPVPVDRHPQGVSAFGVEDLMGNGWEWTSSRFGPFPGFSALPFYPGYSADFFDGGHFVLKGASPCTDNVFLRRSFRNWFRPDYPYLFAGFRCVYKHP